MPLIWVDCCARSPVPSWDCHAEAMMNEFTRTVCSRVDGLIWEDALDPEFLEGTEQCVIRSAMK